MLNNLFLGKSSIYRLLHDMPLDVSLYLMAKSGRPLTKKAFSTYFTQLQHARVHLSGKDLQKLGIAPGRRYRQILDCVQDAVLNGKVSGREEEMRFVRENFLKDS